MQPKSKKSPPPMTAQRLESYALFLLGRQDYTAKTMVEKLTLKYPPKTFDDSEHVISALMSKLKNLGYINDERFLSSKVQSLLEQNIGSAKINQRLVAKGFEPAAIKQALAHLKDSDSVDFFEKALASKIKKFGSQPIQDKAQAQKALGFLVRQGFSFGDALKAIKHTGESED